MSKEIGLTFKDTVAHILQILDLVDLDHICRHLTFIHD